MEPPLLADAMSLAISLSQAEARVAAERPVTDAWLQDGMAAVAYDDPSGADGDGVVPVGEVRELRAERTGFVLVHPQTKALRIAGSNEFGN